MELHDDMRGPGMLQMDHDVGLIRGPLTSCRSRCNAVQCICREVAVEETRAHVTTRHGMTGEVGRCVGGTWGAQRLGWSLGLVPCS